MRYAITFSTDMETWDSVDTLIVETDVNPLDMDYKQLYKTFYGYLGDRILADDIAKHHDMWFCRNLADTDVDVREKR